MGPEHIIVTVSLDFRDELSAAQVEDTVSRLTQAIKTDTPAVKRVFIEAESQERHGQRA
jgi:divalent metal cation (Fe/Co/Zn/Cd) transporter